MLKIARASIISAAIAVAAVSTANAQSFQPAPVEANLSVRGTVVRLRLVEHVGLPETVEAKAPGSAETPTVEVAVKVAGDQLYFAYVDLLHEPAVGDAVKIAAYGNGVRIVE
ncbi:hypothetical protein [Paraburkholderia sp. SIMBA_054]|uniref:hypothetical protein n=1 Tax=Paraburkholderia sp. SIMBA_054 TaxID=3085795 RepID=UPI0039789BA2